MRRMRRHGNRVTTATGKYAGHQGTVESEVCQRTVDYSDEWAYGYHVRLDSEELVTVRRDQMEPLRSGRPVSNSLG